MRAEGLDALAARLGALTEGNTKPNAHNTKLEEAAARQWIMCRQLGAPERGAERCVGGRFFTSVHHASGFF